MPPPQPILLLGPLRLEVEQAECLPNEPLGSMLHHSLGGEKGVRLALAGRRGKAGCLGRLVAVYGGRNCSESTSQTTSFMV
jgi:hypothetical protein